VRAVLMWVAGLACGRPGGDHVATDAPLAIIDAHIHTDFTGEPEPSSRIPYSREELARQMAAAGAVGAVAHTDAEGGGYADLSAAGVIHCAGIDVPVAVPRIAEGLRSGRYRCLKIYLGYVHHYAADPAYEPAYRLAAEYDVPVVFHTGDTYSSGGKLKYADPMTIDDVAVDHPNVRFVIAHAGNPWIQSAAEVAYKNPNVVLEASALMLGNASTTDPAWVDRYVTQPISWIFGYIEDPSKLLFGSDWPLVDIPSYVEAYKRAIPREHWQAVFHDNAVRTFGMVR
jgi:hypothetical protein